MVQVGLHRPWWDRLTHTCAGRFITPIFLHAGLIHYLLNILAQLTASAQVSIRPAAAAALEHSSNVCRLNEKWVPFPS